MTPLLFIGIVLAVIVATALKSITGFGTALLLMPLFSSVFDIREAIVVMALVDLFSSSLILYRDSRHATIKDLKELTVGLLVGTIIGVLLLKVIGTTILKVLLSVFIFAYIIIQQFDIKFNFEKSRNKKMIGYIFGLLGGFFGGMFSTNGPAIFMYIKSAFPKKEVVRANLVLIFFIDSLWRSGLLLISGQFSRNAILLFALVTLPALLFGTYIGAKIDKKIKSNHYTVLSKAILFISGIKLLAR